MLPLLVPDVGGAQACSTSNVTVQAPAQAVTAAAINALGDSLNTALASGSTDALLSVVRQLSAATSTASGGEGGEEAQAAATEQAEQAMGAMEDLLSEDGATAEEVLGVADAGVCEGVCAQGPGHSSWMLGSRGLCSAGVPSAVLSLFSAYSLSPLSMCQYLTMSTMSPALQPSPWWMPPQS